MENGLHPVQTLNWNSYKDYMNAVNCDLDYFNFPEAEQQAEEEAREDMNRHGVGKGAHSNNLMDSYTNPITGANCYNECKVRVRPAT